MRSRSSNVITFYWQDVKYLYRANYWCFYLTRFLFSRRTCLKDGKYIKIIAIFVTSLLDSKVHPFYLKLIIVRTTFFFNTEGLFSRILSNIFGSSVTYIYSYLLCQFTVHLRWKCHILGLICSIYVSEISILPFRSRVSYLLFSSLSYTVPNEFGKMLSELCASS